MAQVHAVDPAGSVGRALPLGAHLRVPPHDGPQSSAGQPDGRWQGLTCAAPSPSSLPHTRSRSRRVVAEAMARFTLQLACRQRVLTLATHQLDRPLRTYRHLVIFYGFEHGADVVV